MRRSLARLCCLAGVPNTRSKAAICKLIASHGHCLPAKQRAALEAWCRR